ncbi:MAG: hypothetical protein D6759_01245 [Chloroflexi bacterium]|nr:MAG: hypothetical protein D6759_01245 [Chloroflexota bacterium]
MRGIVVEVVTPVLTFQSHCSQCEFVFDKTGLGVNAAVQQEAINTYPQWLQEAYLQVSDWVREIAQRYQGAVRVCIVDPQSLEGMWRLLRYWIRRYPTFLLDGQKFVGWESEPALRAAIEERLSAQGWRKQDATAGH